MKKITVTAFVIITTLIACKTAEKSKTTASTPATTSTPAPVAPAGNVTYAVDIKPIMERYCVSCHNENQKAGYDLSQLAFVKKAGANGELLGTIKHMDGYDPMPAMEAKMDDAIIAKIEAWVKGGMN